MPTDEDPSISPPGEDELVVSGSNDKTIRVWRAATGQCISLLEGHEGLVRALAYDRVSGRLVSASYDRNVILWELKRTPPRSSLPTGSDEVPAAEGVVDDGLGGVSAKKLRVFKGNHSSHIFDVKFDLTRIIR